MELRSLKLFELKELAKSKGIHDAYKYKKDELIFKLNEIGINNNNIKNNEKNDLEISEGKEETEQMVELPDKIVEEIESSGTEALKVTGILETHSDGYGFLRTHNYLTSDDDVYISPSQIRRFRMQTGDKISGITRPPKQGEKFKALLYVKEVNDENPELA
ncbi:MAG TPA: transcription termination factor Rho, partial [Clostridiales bacterium]|nr:transcription termination factor Rho [Clostridiales bacterium]